MTGMEHVKDEERENNKVILLRERLKAQHAWDERKHDAFALRRFLRARNWAVDDSEAMWVTMLQWRMEWGVDSMLSKSVLTEDRRKRLMEIFPHGLHGVDRVGRPVLIYRMGKIDVSRVTAEFPERLLQEFHIQMYEFIMQVVLPACSLEAGRHVDQVTNIFDLAGLGIWAMSRLRALFLPAMSITRDNYPETLGQVVIVNAPAMFDNAYTVVKRMLSPETQAKIQVLGKNYHSALDRFIAAPQLPQFLGGSSHAQLGDNHGPWSNLITQHRHSLDLQQPLAQRNSVHSANGDADARASSACPQDQQQHPGAAPLGKPASTTPPPLEPGSRHSRTSVNLSGTPRSSGPLGPASHELGGRSSNPRSSPTRPLGAMLHDFGGRSSNPRASPTWPLGAAFHELGGRSSNPRTSPTKPPEAGAGAEDAGSSKPTTLAAPVPSPGLQAAPPPPADGEAEAGRPLQAVDVTLTVQALNGGSAATQPPPAVSPFLSAAMSSFRVSSPSGAAPDGDGGGGGAFGPASALDTWMVASGHASPWHDGGEQRLHQQMSVASFHTCLSMAESASLAAYLSRPSLVGFGSTCANQPINEEDASALHTEPSSALSRKASTATRRSAGGKGGGCLPCLRPGRAHKS